MLFLVCYSIMFMPLGERLTHRLPGGTPSEHLRNADTDPYRGSFGHRSHVAAWQLDCGRPAAPSAWSFVAPLEPAAMDLQPRGRLRRRCRHCGSCSCAAAGRLAFGATVRVRSQRFPGTTACAVAHLQPISFSVSRPCCDGFSFSSFLPQRLLCRKMFSLIDDVSPNKKPAVLRRAGGQAVMGVLPRTPRMASMSLWPSDSLSSSAAVSLSSRSRFSVRSCSTVS